MPDPQTILLLAAAALAGLAMLLGAALQGWRGWLQLKHRQIGEPAAPTASGRIEMADLRERVRKLEAIAAGVEL